MTDISKHPLLKQCYEVCVAIEQCGVSVELTEATTKCSDLLSSLNEWLVDDPEKEVTLHSRIEWLCKKHSGLRAAARMLDIDHGYLSRLRHGEKINPSDGELQKLGLKRQISYRAMNITEEYLEAEAKHMRGRESTLDEKEQ